jgi:acyl carrier protein
MTDAVTYSHSDAELLDIVVEEIVALRPSQFDRQQIALDTLLYSLDPDDGPALDLDSLDALELISALENRLHCAVDDELDPDAMRTVADIVSTIGRSL